MRIMFEMKTEEMGGKGCVMRSFIIYTAGQILGYPRSVAQWVSSVSCMGVKVILNGFLIGKREGKSLFRRPVQIWEDNIKMDFKELCQDGF
jgi:hypothetical protein